MIELSEDSQASLTSSIEAERAIHEAQKEPSWSLAQLRSRPRQQMKHSLQFASNPVSLDQGQAAAQSLASLSEDLRGGSAGQPAAEQISSMAEELSATIQELSSAASQISAAVDQINRGSQQQAAAAQQTSAALAQIEKSARFAQERGRLAVDRTSAMGKKLAEARTGVEQMIQAVGETLEETRGSLETIVSLSQSAAKSKKMSMR